MSGTINTLPNSRFTAGDLVVSLSGDGANTGTYGDNQASPMVLDELTTSGTFVGQIVLPQTTTVVNGVTEYAISSEYGSSSEGSLELSADGQSLVIAGYGVSATTFNSGGAAVYGTAALAQSTSVEGGTYTPVARIIADISYSGTIDTSTDLYNVFNLNNPRSVATVNGNTFYVSGQASPGTPGQGVVVADDGSNTATSIDPGTDTRTVEIVNVGGVNELFVSRDSTQVSGTEGGGGQISDYGATLPTGPTTATVLTGINDHITLTAAQENGINNADVGTSVNLSPENYFFAGPTTLYVADGGAPKEGGLGDGGLQKWTENPATGVWTLEYTLTSGLNLVPDTASSGSTGLIGLTGVVSGGNVTLYTTNETVADLNATGVYEITDSLTATSAAAGEAFTEIFAAPADSNVRGIAFAPTQAAASTSSGTTPTIVSSGETLSSGFTVSAGSALQVQSGGTVIDAVISSGGFEVISAGGIDSGSDVLNAGSQTVFGSAVGDMVAGNQLISGGAAVVTGEDVLNGGTVDVATATAIVSGMTVENGGSLVISGASASAAATIVDGGTVTLLSAGQALTSGLDFTGPGTVTLSAGAGISGVISGFQTGDVIDGTGIASAGATLSETAVGSNLVVTLSNGGTSQAFTFTAAAGGKVVLSADASGGAELVSGTASTDPFLTIVSAGTTYSSNVSNGYVVDVDSGGAVSGSTIESGGFVTVSSGGKLSASTVAGGGSAVILLGGADSGSTLQAGGFELISGAAAGDAVSGTQLASASSATVTSETVYGGGVVDLYLAGVTATSLTVSNGGTVNISGHAVAANTTISAGGLVTLQSPKATLTGSVTFVGAAEIQVTGATSAGYGDQAVISGFGAGDVIDIATIASSGATLSGTLSGGNVVETVTNGGTSQSFIFAPANNAKLVLSSDPNGFAEIVSGAGVSATAPVTSTISSGVFSGTIGSGAILTFVSSASVSGASILAGGSAIIGTGVTDTASTVFAGGSETVSGTVNGDQVYGSQVFVSGNATGVNETVQSGGSISVISAGDVLTGVTVESGGTVVMSKAVTTSNAIISGGTLELLSPAPTLKGSFTFAGAGGVVDIASAATAGSGFSPAVVSGFAPGDTISFTSGALGANAIISMGSSGGNTTIKVLSGLTTEESFTFLGSGYTFNFTSAVTGGGYAYTLTPNTACYCRGTRILTAVGDVAVESLSIGDLVVTARGAVRPIKWIGRRAYAGRFAAGKRKLLPVTIKADALGERIPARDLSVSPQHAMLIDGVLVQAIDLVNGTSIVQATSLESVEYFHVELDSHDAILAEGAPSETFIDDDSRQMFENAAEFAALYPGARMQPAVYCAPRVEDGPELAAIRQKIAARVAGPAPSLPDSLRGYLDAVTHGMAEGWAWVPGKSSPVRLRIRVNGVVIGHTLADLHRPGLAEAGIGDGRCAFRFAIPGGLDPARSHRVQVERAEDGRELTGSPLIVAAMARRHAA